MVYLMASILCSVYTTLLSSPVIAVECAVVDGLEDVVWLNVALCLKVGDGACDLYYTVIGACRQV